MAEETPVLRFSTQDLDWFGRTSFDRNPLHVSPAYARATPYRERLVHGVLATLYLLGRLPARPDSRCTTLTVEFLQPLFSGIDYAVATNARAPDRATAQVRDGRRVMLKVEATFAPVAAPATAWTAAACAATTEARSLVAADLVPGLQQAGTYAPDPDGLQALVERSGATASGFSVAQVVALLWCGYLVGMELPGRRALFSRLDLTFAGDEREPAGPLVYRSSVVAFDARFNLVMLEATLGPDAATWARAKLRAFVREDVPPPDAAALGRLLPATSTLSGRLALVTGASRGLGAALALALAWQGCTVLANFVQSRDAAQALQAAAAQASGEIVLLQGDAADTAWCETTRERIARDYGGLDILVCSASPPLLPLWLEPATLARVNRYVYDSLALVSTPLAWLHDLVATNAGWCVVISSAAVEAPPGDWPHYVSAKLAIEGLVRSLAAAQPRSSFLLARPPRLLTDLTNTPLGRQGAGSALAAAAAIVRRLAGPRQPGDVALLDLAQHGTV